MPLNGPNANSACRHQHGAVQLARDNHKVIGVDNPRAHAIIELI